jgi:hypothetical protein
MKNRITSGQQKLNSEQNDERRYSLAPIAQMRLLAVRGSVSNKKKL